jgi:hypothetical protein
MEPATIPHTFISSGSPITETLGTDILGRHEEQTLGAKMRGRLRDRYLVADIRGEILYNAQRFYQTSLLKLVEYSSKIAPKVIAQLL